ncbi:MAG: hypothetical protein IPK60_17430 [Sandaracinaceae bacterium]|nr:hypothetical protein [Sandaracinaceae bacterium]
MLGSRRGGRTTQSWAQARPCSRWQAPSRTAKGAVVVIEFPDGLHEYVTTPVKRILRLAGSKEVYYLQTANSRYRLEVRSAESAVLEAAGK